jgi:hypothetical protein
MLHWDHFVCMVNVCCSWNTVFHACWNEFCVAFLCVVVSWALNIIGSISSCLSLLKETHHIWASHQWSSTWGKVAVKELEWVWVTWADRWALASWIDSSVARLILSFSTSWVWGSMKSVFWFTLYWKFSSYLRSIDCWFITDAPKHGSYLAWCRRRLVLWMNHLFLLNLDRRMKGK